MENGIYVLTRDKEYNLEEKYCQSFSELIDFLNCIKESEIYCTMDFLEWCDKLKEWST